MSLLYPLSSGLRVSAQKWVCHGGIGALRCAIKNSWNAQGTLPPSSQLYMPVLFKIRPLKYHGSTKARGPECRRIKVFLKNGSENCKTRASIHAIPHNLHGKHEERHRCLEIAAGLPRIWLSQVHSDCPQPNIFVYINLNIRESPRVPVSVSRNFYLSPNAAWHWLTPS